MPGDTGQDRAVTAPGGVPTGPSPRPRAHGRRDLETSGAAREKAELFIPDFLRFWGIKAKGQGRFWGQQGEGFNLGRWQGTTPGGGTWAQSQHRPRMRAETPKRGPKTAPTPLQEPTAFSIPPKKGGKKLLNLLGGHFPVPVCPPCPQARGRTGGAGERGRGSQLFIARSFFCLIYPKKGL